MDISTTVYDNGGIGDGNVTETVAFPAGSTSSADTLRVTEMFYDWQDQSVVSKSGALVTEASSLGGGTGFHVDAISDWLVFDPSDEGTGGDTTQRPIAYSALDNLGETTAQYIYAGNDVTIGDTDGVPDQPSSSLLRAENTSDYNAQGEEYQSEAHSVDQSTGAVDSGVDPEISSSIFDPNGNVVSTTSPTGAVSTMDYDGAGRETEMIAPEVYDAATSSWITPTTYTTYDNDGETLTVTDPNGNVSEDYYDPAGREIESVQPDPSTGAASGPATYYTYDTAGEVGSVEDPNGNFIYDTFDALGREISESRPDPDHSGEFLTTYTTFDGDGNTLSVQDANGNTTAYAYNFLNAMVTMTQPSVTDALTGDPAEPVTSESYDNLGDLLQTTNPMDRVTNFSFDTLGEEVSVSQPNPNAGPTNVVTSTVYDTLGDTVSVTDPNSNTTLSEFDGFGRLEETIQPDPNGGTNYPELFYVYDTGNEVVEQIAPAGPASAPNSVQQITAFQYDDEGRETDASQLDGTITSSVTTDSYGVSHLVYSGTSELTTAYGFDADGNKVTTTDPLLNVTADVYDHLNRLDEEIQPSPDGVAADPTTVYTFDTDGNELTETDPDGNVTSYAYNSLDRLTSQSETIGLYLSSGVPVTTVATTDFDYDGNGNTVKETDADGQVTLSTFDALNHETGQQWYANATDAGIGITDADNVKTLSYDLDGELHSASDDFSSYTFSYNSLGEETSVDNNGSGPTGTTGTPGVPDVVLSSTFDAVGNRIGLTATIGGTADFVNTYSYDTLNREDQVTQGASTVSGHDAVDSKLVNFTYNADGQTASIDRFNDLTGTSGDRVATTADGYDDFGRLTSMAHTAADGTTTYAAYTWTYDSGSEVTSFTNAANIADYSNENIATYTYDHDLQLTGATQESGQTANASNSLVDPSYDANGNASSINGGSTITIGAGNTLLFDGTYYDTYDANGSLIEQANSTNEILDSYDNGKRLTSVVDKVFESGSWVKTEELDYTYDLFADLIGRKDTTYESDGVTVAATAIQRYVFDGKNTALALDGSGNLTDRYLSGPAVDQVLADEQFSLSGTNQLPSSAGNTLWALGDNQNSVRDVVNDSGTLQEHIAYSPFGQQTAQSTNPGSVVFVFGYTGTYTDIVTADQLHGVRWYDPASQRWLSQDPLESSMNLYAYCGDSPADSLDPSGLKQEADDPINGWGKVHADLDSLPIGYRAEIVAGTGNAVTVKYAVWQNKTINGLPAIAIENSKLQPFQDPTTNELKTGLYWRLILNSSDYFHAKFQKTTDADPNHTKCPYWVQFRSATETGDQKPPNTTPWDFDWPDLNQTGFRKIYMGGTVSPVQGTAELWDRPGKDYLLNVLDYTKKAAHNDNGQPVTVFLLDKNLSPTMLGNPLFQQDLKEKDSVTYQFQTYLVNPEDYSPIGYFSWGFTIKATETGPQPIAENLKWNGGFDPTVWKKP